MAAAAATRQARANYGGAVAPAVLRSMKACLVATLPVEEQSRRTRFFSKLEAWLESVGGGRQ